MSQEPERVDLETTDPAEAQRAVFQKLFPGVITDGGGVIDADRLGELLGLPVSQATDRRERFGLSWAGKSEAFDALRTPSRATLVPDFDSSIGFDTAQNVLIEGDNLEVLKLLQKAYNDRVKLIYIDPPYNTGNDFIYSDDFSDTLRGYLEYTGQVDDEGKRISTTVDTTGRIHSRWLSMMYPRLSLARNLLTDDGFMAVSIGDEEVSNLRLLCNLVFGERQCVAQIAVNRTSEIATEHIVQKVEYLLVYAKDIDKVDIGGADKIVKSRGTVGNPDQTMPEIEFPAGLRCVNIPDGVYRYARQVQGGKENIDLLTPAIIKGGELAQPVIMKARWRASGDMRNYFSNGCHPTKAKINGTICDIYIDGDRFMPWIVKKSVEKIPTYFGENRRGSKDLAKLGITGFDYPKSVEYIKWILGFGLKNGGIVLDFFAGSGTTAQAVMEMNAVDGATRRFILIQLPEPTGHDDYQLMSDITRARVKAVIETLSRSLVNNQPVGVRELRLSRSNFHEVTPAADLIDLAEQTLPQAPELQSVAAEVLLKEGVTLDSPWERCAVSDDVEIVLADGIAVVLSLAITDEIAQAALDLTPRVVVFLEDGFVGRDTVKANAFWKAQQLGITMKTV